MVVRPDGRCRSGVPCPRLLQPPGDVVAQASAPPGYSGQLPGQLEAFPGVVRFGKGARGAPAHRVATTVSAAAAERAGPSTGVTAPRRDRDDSQPTPVRRG